MRQTYSHLTGMLFGGLLLLAAATILLPARQFSQNENRLLTQRPVLSAESVQSGTFQETLDSYLSDQIPFRSGWIRLNTAVKKGMGRREINGVYLGDDHRYFQKFTDDSYSDRRMTAMLQQLETFGREQQLPLYLMLVPSPGTVLRSSMPKHAPYYDADRVYAAAQQLLPGSVIDLRETFGASKEDLYYHTDHHWTSAGAALAYRVFAQTVGKTPRQIRLQTVSRDFRGTLDSRVLEFAAWSDTVEADLHLPKVRVTYDDGRTTDTPYVPEKLEEKDQYGFFFGGNFGKVTIDTGMENGATLLVLKDSFANSFVPFLFEDYSRIVMLDLRYFQGSVAQVSQEEQPEAMLVLYEMSNFLTDTGMVRLNAEF